jgi:branched-chain amino acid transport system substrate-binding protein
MFTPQGTIMTQPIHLSRRGFIAASAALAACAAAPSLVRAQSAQPFRLGALNSITGVGGPYGPAMLEAIKIAIDEVNAAGGAAGRKNQL